MKQKGTAYRLGVPVVVQLEQGREYRTWIDIRRNEQTMALWVPAKPLRVQLDPAYQTFRRLDRQAMSPILNGWVTDRHRAVLLASTTPEPEQQSLKPAIDRIRSQHDDTAWLDERTVLDRGAIGVGHGPSPNQSMGGQNPSMVRSEQVRLEEQSITIQENHVLGRSRSRAGQLCQSHPSRTRGHGLLRILPKSRSRAFPVIVFLWMGQLSCV